MDIQKYYMACNANTSNHPYRASKINENNSDKSYGYNLNSFIWVPYNLDTIEFPITIVAS